MEDDDDVKSIAEDITEYLRQRPGSADSLEGVAHWWLPRQSMERQLKLLSKALELLAVQGKVSKSTNSKGETIYRLTASDDEKSQRH